MSLQKSEKLIKEFDEGEIIIREGDLGDCAYILESGRAKVFKKLPSLFAAALY